MTFIENGKWNQSDTFYRWCFYFQQQAPSSFQICLVTVTNMKHIFIKKKIKPVTSWSTWCVLCAVLCYWERLVHLGWKLNFKWWDIDQGSLACECSAAEEPLKSHIMPLVFILCMFYVFKGEFADFFSPFTDFYTIVITFNLTNKKYIKPLVLHVLSVSPVFAFQAVHKYC